MKLFVVIEKENPSLLYRIIGHNGYFVDGEWFTKRKQAEKCINSKYFPILYKILKVELREMR